PGERPDTRDPATARATGPRATIPPAPGRLLVRDNGKGKIWAGAGVQQPPCLELRGVKDIMADQVHLGHHLAPTHPALRSSLRTATRWRRQYIHVCGGRTRQVVT